MHTDSGGEQMAWCAVVPSAAAGCSCLTEKKRFVQSLVAFLAGCTLETSLVAHILVTSLAGQILEGVQADPVRTFLADFVLAFQTVPFQTGQADQGTLERRRLAEEQVAAAVVAESLAGV